MYAAGPLKPVLTESFNKAEQAYYVLDDIAGDPHRLNADGPDKVKFFTIRNGRRNASSVSREDLFTTDELKRLLRGFSSTRDRVHGQTIQGYVYAATRPCVFTGECPEGRNPGTCEAMENSRAASKCPVSVSLHAVRRGSITYWLQRDVPVRVVSDRANVSQAVLDKHYDRRTEREKVEQRRRYLENVQ